MDQGGLSPIITASALLLLVSLLILSRFITGLLQKKKREAAIAKLAAGFAASLQHEEWLVRGEGFSFSYLIEAVPWWSWKQFSKGRGIGKFLEIAVPCEGQNCLTLRRRQRFSDGIWISKSKEIVESGNDEFDARFIVVVEGGKSGAAFLRSFENRQAIERLFAAGFDVLCCSKGRLHVVKSIRSYDELAQDVIAGAAAQLQVLSRNMGEGSSAKETVPKRVRGRKWLLGLLTLLLLSSSTFVFVFYGTLDSLKLAGVGTLLGLVLSVLTFVLFSPGILKMLPGKEASARQSFLGVFVAAAFVLSYVASAIILAVNCRFDNSPPRIVTALVTLHEAGPLGFLGIYELGLRSWRREGGLEMIAIDKENWEDARDGVDCLTLFLRDGRFGYAWVESFTLVSGNLDTMCASQRGAVVQNANVIGDRAEDSEDAELEIFPAVSAATHFSEEEEALLEKNTELKKRFDEYYKRAMDHILEHWPWDDMSVDLRTSIEVQLSSQGVITKMKTVERSGNNKFDNEALKALRKASPLPAPSEDLMTLVDELRISFHSRMGPAEEEPEAD